jgi:hypothetical protein
MDRYAKEDYSQHALGRKMDNQALGCTPDAESSKKLG